ncbi:hypothetical protein ACWCOZ_24475 [Streptomyces sp. NPDC001840]
MVAGLTMALMAGLGACGSGSGQNDNPWEDSTASGGSSGRRDEGHNDDQGTAPDSASEAATVTGLRDAVRRVSRKTTKVTRAHGQEVHVAGSPLPASRLDRQAPYLGAHQSPPRPARAPRAPSPSVAVRARMAAPEISKHYGAREPVARDAVRAAAYEPEFIAEAFDFTRTLYVAYRRAARTAEQVEAEYEAAWAQLVFDRPLRLFTGSLLAIPAWITIDVVFTAGWLINWALLVFLTTAFVAGLILVADQPSNQRARQAAEVARLRLWVTAWRKDRADARTKWSTALKQNAVLNPGERPRTHPSTAPTRLESAWGATPHKFESRILRHCSHRAIRCRAPPHAVEPYNVISLT